MKHALLAVAAITIVITLGLVIGTALEQALASGLR